MTNRKTYNSIVFLAAFFGLALVGASPQVLAQVENSQRNAQSFIDLTNPEIKRFIEFKYDEKLAEFARGTAVRLEFVKLESPEKILDESFYAKSTNFAPYLDEDGKLLEQGFIDSDKDSEWMSAAQAGIMADINLELLDHFSDSTERKAKKSVFQSSVEIILDDSEYKCELVIKKSSNQRAENLAGWLREAVDYSASKSKEGFAKQIYENTKAFSENNQVFIVTRLPRASIDEILAARNAH